LISEKQRKKGNKYVIDEIERTFLKDFYFNAGPNVTLIFVADKELLDSIYPSPSGILYAKYFYSPHFNKLYRTVFHVNPIEKNADKTVVQVFFRNSLKEDEKSDFLLVENSIKDKILKEEKYLMFDMSSFDEDSIIDKRPRKISQYEIMRHYMKDRLLYIIQKDDLEQNLEEILTELQSGKNRDISVIILNDIYNEGNIEYEFKNDTLIMSRFI